MPTSSPEQLVQIAYGKKGGGIWVPKSFAAKHHIEEANLPEGPIPSFSSAESFSIQKSFIQNPFADEIEIIIPLPGLAFLSQLKQSLIPSFLGEVKRGLRKVTASGVML